ncbi:cobalt-zinc-cadmium resistance protein CzcC precursor [mine drainage metagenome]|uniref:Cobalt-zinc-cadmium resistance protein CzcC n=1 Tax=mine drainage metagenome TaxID=410659 RepID=A0A1J5T5W8_9ZZZZ
MKPSLSIFTVLCALWLTPAVADEPLGSSLTGLLDYAREHNPELAALRLDAEAAQQRTEPASALPDPVLRTQRYDITSQAANMIPNVMPVQSYQLSQFVPWFGKRDLQRGIATAQMDQANGQTAADWSDLANRLKTGYATSYYLAASEQLTQQNLGLLEHLEQIVRERYSNGLSSQQDVVRVQVETTTLLGELIGIQNERHHEHAKLNSLLSRPVNSPLADPIQPRPLPAAAKLDEDALLERLRAHNPQLQIAEAQIQSADKSRDLAYSNRYPGFTLGVARTQYSSINTWDVMVEFSIPLQQSVRRSQEHEAAAMRAAASARKQSTLNQAESSLSENLSALESARRTEALIATRLLPQSELTYQSALAGYETGKVDFATLIDAQRQILQARQQQLKTQLEAQSRLADIEKLLGEEL